MAKRICGCVAVVAFTMVATPAYQCRAEDPPEPIAADVCAPSADGLSSVCVRGCACSCRGGAGDYVAEWERAGLGPYLVQTPDILLIEVPRSEQRGEQSTDHTAGADSSKPADVETIAGQHAVFPNGEIDLGRFGTLYVSGKTLDEVRQAVEEKLADAVPGVKVNVQLAACNSKCVYVILDNAESDSVNRAKYLPQSKVGDVLRQAAWPQPIDFRTAEITVRRQHPIVSDDLDVKYEESIQQVEWDVATCRPTAESNFALQPGDRVIVKLPKIGIANVQATPAAFVAAPSPSPAQISDSTDPASVKFDIRIVADTSGSFQEFEQLQKMPFMLGDTATIRGTLRILEKNDLIEQISSPNLVATVGEEATVEIGGPSKTQIWEGLKLNCSAQQFDRGLIVCFGIKNTADKRDCELRTSLIVPRGQTVIIKTKSPLENQPTEDGATSDDADPVYVVLTAEIVKPSAVPPNADREASRPTAAVAQ